MRKSNTALFLVTASFFCILFTVPSFGENDPYIPIHLDGFNTILFNPEYPHRSLNMYSFIYGNPLDRFPLEQLSYFPDITFSNYDSIKNSGKDSLFRLQASGTLGSEYGDPMLNGLEGFSRENRDHFTTFAAACNIPKTPMHVFFGYRYIDNYSDRFDEKWKRFREKMGREMVFSDEGLAYEIVGGYSLTGQIATTTLRTLSYKHWGFTPFYFAPMFSTGYILSPILAFNLPRSKLWIDLHFNYHKDYFDHFNFTDYADEGWEVRWQKKLKKGIIAQISHHKDSKRRPSSYLNTTLHDTIPDLLIWNLSGNLHGNRRLGGAVDISYIQIPKFSLDVHSSWDYVPKSRNYKYYENDWPFEYYSLQYETANFHSALRYSDTLLTFPVKASVWLDYCEKPIWETVYNAKPVILKQNTVKDAAHLTYGGKGSYTISLFDKLSITLWGNLVFTPKEKLLRFELPRNLGTDITFGRLNSDSLYIALKIENRDSTTFRYYKENDNSILHYIAPAQTSAYLFLKMPFLFPLFREHLRTSFQIGAGPIRLSREQRLTEFPLGNPIGPTISFGINGFIN